MRNEWASVLAMMSDRKAAHKLYIRSEMANAAVDMRNALRDLDKQSRKTYGLSETERIAQLASIRAYYNSAFDEVLDEIKGGR